ncbi:MAG: DUF3067 family protein [Synechococcaceae cyanobacterium SM2_3_2]|nr:DUF3067 family protein [Synechococcaceae cyanobacterium SM2_3_2]
MTRTSNPGSQPSGADLRQLILQKWGKPYDVQLRRVGERVSLLVMWRYLGQQSFPLSEAEYQEHLASVATTLQEWGVYDRLCQEMVATRQRPRMGQAVAIPIDLSGVGDRLAEWLL